MVQTPWKLKMPEGWGRGKEIGGNSSTEPVSGQTVTSRWTANTYVHAHTHSSTHTHVHTHVYCTVKPRREREKRGGKWKRRASSYTGIRFEICTNYGRFACIWCTSGTRRKHSVENVSAPLPASRITKRRGGEGGEQLARPRRNCILFAKRIILSFASLKSSSRDPACWTREAAAGSDTI